MDILLNLGVEYIVVFDEVEESIKIVFGREGEGFESGFVFILCVSDWNERFMIEFYG